MRYVFFSGVIVLAKKIDRKKKREGERKKKRKKERKKERKTVL